MVFSMFSKTFFENIFQKQERSKGMFGLCFLKPLITILENT